MEEACERKQPTEWAAERWKDEDNRFFRHAPKEDGGAPDGGAVKEKAEQELGVPGGWRGLWTPGAART